MSFKTLEQRYKEKVNDLYRGATSKFDNGRPSRGANDDPIIVRRVGDGYFGGVSRALGRFLPVTSAFQDVKRLTLFTASIRGATFLAKQALLQTGNTFQATRLLNPAFTIANAVPFLRVRRHLSGLSLSGLIGKTDTSYNNVRKLGQLQKETYDKVRGYPVIFTSPITTTRNVGEIFNWNQSRPELATNIIAKYAGSFSTAQITDINKAGEIPSTVPFKFGGTPGKAVFYTPQGTRYLKLPLDIPSVRGRDYQDGALSKQLRVDEKFNPVQVQGDSQARSNLITTSSVAISIAHDPSAQQREKFIRYRNTNPTAKNKINDVIGQNGRDASNAVGTSGLRGPYNTLNNNFDDYITVSFAMGNEPPLKFRAFLTDLQQSATPQYKEYQYIGRTEKFISYSGVQREVSFKLGVLALHPDELTQVWKRINYLTGTVFPYTVTRGIYQPNIVRMTIGKVFVNQPMYVTSLTTNFTEILESWDIDQEVPHSARMDMKCLLIEKTQRIASSPFYSIVEGA